MGEYHMKNALEASVPPVQSERLRSWLHLEDYVLSRAAAIVLGTEGLRVLASDYIAKGEKALAATMKFLLVELAGSSDGVMGRPLLKEALALLHEAGPLTTASQKLEVQVLTRYQWLINVSEPNGEEMARVMALMEKAQKNPAIVRDLLSIYLGHVGINGHMYFGWVPSRWNGGQMISNDDVYKGLVLQRDEWHPLLKQLCNQYPKGSRRRQYHECITRMYLHPIAGLQQCHGTKEIARVAHAFSTAEWGDDNHLLVDSLQEQSYERHHSCGRDTLFNYQCVLTLFILLLTRIRSRCVVPSRNLV